MRKNTARHWLHAALDLLPVILIPVFMIYSHRHEINSDSIEVPQQISVDYNQLLNCNKNTSSYGIDLNAVNFTITLNGQATNSSYTYKAYSNYIDFELNHIYLLKSTNSYNTFNGIFQMYLNYPYRIFNLNTNNRFVFNDSNPEHYRQQLWLVYNSTFNCENLVITQNLYDLTQMFGVGNEPTSEEFDLIFNNEFSYYVDSKQILIDSTPIVYDDTDIMSQFTYQMYNAVDKYFNMGNVFNMNNVYRWFELNIFGGSAPLYIYIVWNIVLYEFVMDLLFLLYALFMWFIDMTKRLIEKPLDSIK